MRQPDDMDDYPTESAYLAVCAANEKKRLRIAELEAQRWIPVSERLPNVNIPVLAKVAWMDEIIIAAQVGRGSGFSWVEQSEFIEIHGDAYTTHDLDTCKVTHWMPLPTPPKEDA